MRSAARFITLRAVRPLWRSRGGIKRWGSALNHAWVLPDAPFRFGGAKQTEGNAPCAMQAASEGYRTLVACGCHSPHRLLVGSLALAQALRHRALGRCPKPRKGCRP